jgi:hypothetical protein
VTSPVHEAVARVELLDRAELSAVRNAIHALRPRWTRRHETVSFFTLGAASYLDAREGGFAAYQEQARQTNPILIEHFGWLLDRVRATVSAHVHAGVRYDERLARPGFHVYLFDEGPPTDAPSVHYDLQYELIDWSRIGAADPSSQLSLTLTIALPAAGGGLLVWNINRLELDRMSPAERQAHSAANRAATFLPYTPGHLVIHSGHQLHQIAAIDDRRPGDERITLQAHALRVDGEWTMYW